jgi:signal transduction histidine kinase
MPQLDEQVARRLTRFYVLALTMIALLTMAGIGLVRHTLAELSTDGRVVNVAGRQRMLSQQLTKRAVFQTYGLTTSDTTSFDSLLSIWYSSHAELRAGTLRMEKPYNVPKSATLDQMFAQLEPPFQVMYGGLRQLALPVGNVPSRTVTDREAALRVVLAEEPTYLSRMNAIVFRFDAEAEARVHRLERIEWLLAGLTLLTLLVEAMLIFRPVVHQTRLSIRRLAESEEALRRATEEKHRLEQTRDRIRAAALLEGQENERRRFAHDLHDGIGQMLTGLKLHAQTLRKMPFADAKHRRRADELCTLVSDTIQATRQVSHNLMPSVLNDFGLPAALRLLAGQTAYSASLPVTFSHVPAQTPPTRLPPTLEIGLYRIAQEALNNAVKHADARSIQIRLQQIDELVTLTITDDGRGFVVGLTPEQPNYSGISVSGIETMRTRAQLLNGTLTIISGAGGTLVKGEWRKAKREA